MSNLSEKTFDNLRHTPIELAIGGSEWVLFMVDEYRSKFVVAEGPDWTEDFGKQIFETCAGDRAIIRSKSKWAVR